MSNKRHNHREEYDYLEDDYQEEEREAPKKKYDTYAGIDPTKNYQVLQYGYDCVQIKYRGRPLWVYNWVFEQR